MNLLKFYLTALPCSFRPQIKNTGYVPPITSYYSQSNLTIIISFYTYLITNYIGAPPSPWPLSTSSVSDIRFPTKEKHGPNQR